MSTDTKLIERRPARAGANTFPLGLAWGEFVAMILVAIAVIAWTLTHTDATNLVAGLTALAVCGAIFLVPVHGKLRNERLIHLAPRYARFWWEVTAGRIDVHTRTIESAHHTHRTLPGDIPFSIHIGEHAWLSSFDWRGNPIGLVIQDGTRWRPWRASHAIVVQVAGHDSLLLESAGYHENLLARWVTMLDSLSKQNLGLSGVQPLMMSRPLENSEGAHWVFNTLLGEGHLADYYRGVQSVHDANTKDRRMFIVLRSGGTFGSWCRARHQGSSRAGVEAHCRLLLDKLSGPNGQSGLVGQAKLKLVRAVDVDRLAALFRLLVDPSHAPAVGYREGGMSQAMVGSHIAPVAEWDVHRDHLVVNGVWFQTFRVVGWPVQTIGPHFLQTALVNHPGGLRVSELFTPEDRNSSLYTNRAAQTNAQSKAEKRAAKGTVTTAQDVIDDSHAVNQDVEMAAGHTPGNYIAHLTTVSKSEEEMRRAGDELATACDSIGVDIQPCYAFQSEAFRHTLPLAWVA